MGSQMKRGDLRTAEKQAEEADSKGRVKASALDDLQFQSWDQLQSLRLSEPESKETQDDDDRGGSEESSTETSGHKMSASFSQDDDSESSEKVAPDHLHRMVTTGKRACAAFGFFFDIEASENHSVCIQQILTASYILANRTLKISAWCTPGGSEGKETKEAAWEHLGTWVNHSGLPKLDDYDPEGPDNYGPIPLARPITIAKGSKMGFCIHTDHPWGIVLRALVPASADFPETLEGSGMHKINLGDVTDSNLHVKLRAGRVLSNPLSTPFQLRKDTEMDAYGLCGIIEYKLLPA
uniref:Uncharacterized protein n=1 Tax=Guillardia theta TaxID=55529 RepID=A0A7S4KZX3_GUITH